MGIVMYKGLANCYFLINENGNHHLFPEQIFDITNNLVRSIWVYKSLNCFDCSHLMSSSHIGTILSEKVAGPITRIVTVKMRFPRTYLVKQLYSCNSCLAIFLRAHPLNLFEIP